MIRIIRRRRILVAALLVGVAAMALFLARGMGKGEFRWAPQSKVYRMKSHATSRYYMGDALLPLVTVDIEGLLEFKLFPKKDDEILAGIKLSGVRAVVNGVISDKTSEMYEGEMLVDMTEEGEMIRFHFPASMPVEKKEIIKSLLKQFEVLTKDGKKKRVFRQTDATGKYIAAYDYRDTTSVKKRKKKYLNIATSKHRFAGNMSADILLSDIQFDIKHSDCWLANLNGQENILLKTGDAQRIASVKQRFELRQLPTRDETKTPFWHSRTYEQVLTAFNADKSSAPEMNQADALHAAKSLPEKTPSLEEKLQSFHDKLSVLTNKGLISDSDDFKRFLIDNPDVVEMIPELIRTGDSPSKHAILIGTLGIIGTDEAQKSLGTILEDPRMSSNNRLRAAIAFGSLTVAPTESTFGTMAHLADTINENNEENEIPGAALFSLGTISSNIGGRDAITAINDTLVSMLDNAANDIQTYYVLGALGNAAQVDLAPEILPFLEDDDSRLRLAAAEALRDIDTAGTQDALFERFQIETEPAVRSRIAESLTKMNLPPSTADALASLTLEESDTDVRRRLIAFIAMKGNAISDRDNLVQRLIEKEKTKNNIKALLKIKAK